MDVSKEKRNRGPNYSQSEKDLLISLVAKHKNILENKKTDAVTIHEKDAAWDRVGREFNSIVPNCTKRSVESLRKFYENKKKDMRKRTANERMEFMRTGGGPPPPKQTCTTSDELLLSLMNHKTVYGLDNPFDGDRDMKNNHNDPIETAVDSATSSYSHNHSGEVAVDYQLERGDENKSYAASSGSNKKTAKNEMTQGWKNYKILDLQTIPFVEIENSEQNNPDKSNKETPNKSLKNSQNLRRRRPATVVRTLTSNHIAEKYNMLLDKRLIICNYEEGRLKQNIVNEKEEQELRKQALKLDVEIKKETLRQLQENH
ncbi:unnamed protein product [Psylliodes chrysocephalus]|uniref:Regulatory protein zeste n=1 Tax=Psylliodes chrysocephalus TaxID=3402493 RepID=A0A9P0CGW9_9CUCU|nr:unnamed protein product [Psylliodes chrysocephala]